MVFPDIFLDHDKPEKQYEQAGMSAPHIVQQVLVALGQGEAMEAPARA
jgi:1-deoxy-D-xylulose-5-phosphate synthase